MNEMIRLRQGVENGLTRSGKRPRENDLPVRRLGRLHCALLPGGYLTGELRQSWDQQAR
jgi:hypothetical protein